MKKTIIMLIVATTTTFSFSQEVAKQEFTGDNFSLEGALVMFKKANSMEEFEKYLNTEENNVNNLDLDKDGNIDYITVDDIVEQNTHIIVLSTHLSATEKQDIATIGIEKTDLESAILQIEGDEDLYSTNTIVEPFEVDEKILKSSTTGPSAFEIIATQVIVNVWFWPCVKFIYSPSYIAYTSPHRWKLYPNWYRPWRPFRNHIFYSNCTPYRNYYHRTAVRRVAIARKIYTPKRHSSKIVVRSKKVNIGNHRNHSANDVRVFNQESRKESKRNNNPKSEERRQNKRDRRR